MVQELYELPEQWKWNKLGDVLDVRDGTHDSPKYQQTGYPLVTSKNLTSVGLDLGNVKYISEKDFRFISKRSGVNKGDILFAMIGTIGNPIIIEKQPNFAIKNVALFKPREEFQCMEYFCYFLLSPDAIGRMLSSSKGAAQKFVGLGVLRGFYVPLPPLNEQKRIVAKLDALFTRIDTAITHLQQTLELSKALFASAYNETFDNIDAPEVELGSIADFFNGFAFKGKELIDKGVPVLRISNIQKGGISFSRMAYFPEQSLSQSIQRFYVEPNDIVIAMSGATTGKVAINDSGMRLLQNQRVGRFVIENEHTRKFIYQFLSIKVEQNLQQALGAAQPNLSTKQIKEIKVPLPSLDKQQAIVDHLDALTERVRTLEATTQEKINDLATLKASLLDAAFKGEL